MTECVRSIAFTIPGKSGVLVKLTEQADGTILFELETQGGRPADLRGLFFDIQNASLLSKLVFTGDDITSTQVANDGVTDLGHGANMKGKGHPTFDVGVEFGTPGIGHDAVIETSFILSANDGTALTLDDFAHVEFGARTTSNGQKIVTLAPAAPDANNDTQNIFEDGASGLNDPSTVPSGVVFNVLANDTDADGDQLSITDVDDGPAHGTVTIAADGKTLTYTPFEDYSGTDSFVYCITDNNGGTDFATVNVTIEAVADIPDLAYEIIPGDTANQFVIRVTASQTDLDGSEFIDLIQLSGLPPGVTAVPVMVDPAGTDDVLTQDFVLTLPPDADANFNLVITAVSKEESNGDTEIGTETVAIVYEHNVTTTAVEFSAVDQSIWSTGDQFTFVSDEFVGIDTGDFNESTGGVLYAGVSGHIQLGFQSTLSFEGGEIDATSNYDVTVETSFNRTTDQLFIETGALLTGAEFTTEGPQGSYTLDFLYDILLNAFAGVNIDAELFSIHEQINLPEISIGPGSFNLIDLDSDDLSGTIEFPPPLNAFSLEFAWPNITTSGSFPPNPVTGSGSSNNFLELELDIDTLVTQLLGIPNVFDPPELSVGPFFADIDLLDVDITGGLNFLQEFAMSLGDLTGMLFFEDGSSQLFTIGDDLLIDDASLIDVNGDGDGQVEFQFSLVPTASLHNETNLGFNIGAEVSLLSVELGYDIEIASDSVTLGPLADFGETFPVGDINVYNATFGLNFGQEQVTGLA